MKHPAEKLVVSGGSPLLKNKNISSPWQSPENAGCPLSMSRKCVRSQQLGCFNGLQNPDGVGRVLQQYLGLQFPIRSGIWSSSVLDTIGFGCQLMVNFTPSRRPSEFPPALTLQRSHNLGVQRTTSIDQRKHSLGNDTTD